MLPTATADRMDPMGEDWATLMSKRSRAALAVLVPRLVGHGVGAGAGRRAAQGACLPVERQPRDLRPKGVGQGAAAAGGGRQPRPA